jgi:tetratricopeptide (TPR) repeat protein/cold shock CspA family protein
LVFEQVLVDPEQRFDVLLRLLKGLNLDYACDSSAFWQLVRGRNVGDTFRSQELGRRFYDAAQDVAGDDPYLLQQRAIFEINHEGGSLELAKKYLDAAARTRPSDPLIKHSQAVLSRELSLKATNPLLRQHLREQAFEKLVGLTGPGAESRAYHTKSLLMLDQLREALEELEFKPEDELIQRKVVEITRETERILEEGLQRFPEDSALQTAEGQFRELIDQHEKAERALRIAFGLNPRQDWIAVRLARKLNTRGDYEGATNLLRECLNQNPSSKAAHLEFARILMTKGDVADRRLVLDHLRRSFTEGDANFDAQFWYAREMFIARGYEESSRIFQSLRHAPIEPRLRRKVRALVRDEKGIIARFEGRIRRKEATYMLIETPLFEVPLFAHITGSSPRAFDALTLGSRVTFEVGFSMEGARAINVRAIDG